MSGDCGHGWGYHKQGPSGPCSKCEEEARKWRAISDDMRDAGRYRWLREQVKTDEKRVLAQAMFWNNGSRGEFDKAVDAARFAPDNSPGAAISSSNGTAK